MNPSALVLQLVRAHYRGDEAAFRSSADALARGAKNDRVREAMFDAVRAGSSTLRGLPRRPAEPFRPPPSVVGASNGMLQQLRPTTFSELMLHDDLQAALDEIIIELEYREHLAERNLRPRSRLLFHGPPGNGKTSVGSAIANALDVAAFGVHLPELMSKWVNATSENLGQLFKLLQTNTLIVFDELDAIGAARGATDHAAGKEANKIVNTLLTLLDRYASGIVIATTNRPDIIDPALRRRFDEELYFPEPTVQQMTTLAEWLCLEHGVSPLDVHECRNFDEVTKRCLTHARRFVMAQILAEERGEEPPKPQQEKPNGSKKEDRLH